jgi:hypothetical protein
MMWLSFIAGFFIGVVTYMGYNSICWFWNDHKRKGV